MAVKVYSVKVPDYRLKKFRKTGKNVILENWGQIPKVYFDNKPDFEKIGAKIDPVLKKNFLGKKVAIRCLGSQEHKGKTIADLVRIIRKTGTDRYDPKRRGERYENVDNKHIDFFALPFTITEKGSYMSQFIEPFYIHPLTEGNNPVRIDIIIIYDRSKLDVVLHRYVDRLDVKNDGFVFKEPENKPQALLGIIKVL